MCKTQLDSFYSLLLRSTKPCCHCAKHSPGTTLGWVWCAGLGCYAGSWKKIKLWENSFKKMRSNSKSCWTRMLTWCHVYWSMGLDCCELSQVVDGKKSPLTRAGKAAFWCPTVMINLLFQEVCCHRQLLVPIPGSGTQSLGSWRCRCWCNCKCLKEVFKEDVTPPQPTEHGKAA